MMQKRWCALMFFKTKSCVFMFVFVGCCVSCVFSLFLLCVFVDALGVFVFTPQTMKSVGGTSKSCRHQRRSSQGRKTSIGAYILVRVLISQVRVPFCFCFSFAFLCAFVFCCVFVDIFAALVFLFPNNEIGGWHQ